MILPFEKLADYRGIVSMVDGSFDPLHVGHLAYFRAARSLGAPLLCNICPDGETAKKHPILLPARDRAEILASLDILTYVHVSERPTVEILRELQPRAYVKGGDWLDKLPAKIGQVCDEFGIRIIYTAQPTQSSTAILARLKPDVDAFEQLVLSQKPADMLWEPTAAVPYDFKSRRIAEGKHPELILETFPGCKILDAGCGPGHLVRLLRERGADARGFDLCPGDDPYVFRADLTDVDMFNDEGGAFSTAQLFDLAICREVLEHLTLIQVRAAVTHLCRLSSRFVYVTTRFTQARHFLDFATSDHLDPTHISILPQDWLRHLFVLEGFRRRADLETQMDWQNKGRVLVYERV